ncbi:hypothetical protein ES703_118427 [subsurface metagenome]
MPGESCLNGYLSCLRVAYFPHQYNIRVVPHYGAQTSGKGQASTRIDLNLANIFKTILHRVFHRDDLAPFGIKTVD